MTMTKSAAKKLINELFNAIPYQVQNGFKTMSDELLALNVAAERKHRKRAYSLKYNFPVADTAKYFVIQHVYDAMRGLKDGGFLYSVESLLSIRYECLLAQAYAMANTEKLTDWYELVKASQFGEIDYCELIA